MTPEDVKFGSIIQAKVLDPQGRNEKSRPLVVVTPNEQIQSGQSILAVAISTTIPNPLPVDYVPLSMASKRRRKDGFDASMLCGLPLVGRNPC